MDTISLYQAGFKNVVASMGTSLTTEQARLIRRYTDKVYISYDGDFAGQSADLRGLEILKAENLTVRVVPLPDRQDRTTWRKRARRRTKNVWTRRCRSSITSCLPRGGSTI